MFDEATRIGASLQALASSPLGDGGTEFLLVDDGSSDGTDEVAAKALAELGLLGRVIRLDRNLGKGGAVCAGMAVAGGRAVAFVDADLSAPPEAVVRCLQLVEDGGADVVVATREHDVVPRPVRRLSSRAFNGLTRRLGLTDRADTQGGLKAFSAEAARMVFRDLRIQRFAFDVEVLLRAQLAGLAVVEVVVPWHHVEESSRVRPLRDGAHMAVDVVRLRRRLRSWDGGRRPLLARLEREHWWYAARRTLVVDEICRAGADRGRALDTGSGTGAMLDGLAAAGFAARVGADASRAALRAGGPGSCAVNAGPERLPFADARFDCLTSLDVIEYLDDDVAALREYRRVTRPGGVVVVVVPAGQWAWSAYDVALGHRRRYSAASLRAALGGAGLDVVRTRHYLAWLLPLTFALGRTPLRSLLRPPEQATFVAPGINRLLGAVAGAERRIGSRVPLPLGMSLLVVARRPA